MGETVFGGRIWKGFWVVVVVCAVGVGGERRHKKNEQFKYGLDKNGGSSSIPGFARFLKLRGGREENGGIPSKPFTEALRRLRPKWTKSKAKNPKIWTKEDRKMHREKLKNLTRNTFGRAIEGPDGRIYIAKGDVFLGMRNKINKTRTEMAMALLKHQLHVPETYFEDAINQMQFNKLGFVNNKPEFRLSEDDKIYRSIRIRQMKRRRKKFKH
mmetsp:Transcript_30961/g.54296  ORF Transcript_30961/g.54296 Transcript_30961/m.54296 type:complete len:213 (-) Transcript_30961:146-784(-)